MRLNIVDNVVIVTLSRRNLESLLSKLNEHPPNSQKTLIRNCENGGQLVVHAENNDEHYNACRPGTIHSATERSIELLKREKEELDSLLIVSIVPS